MALKYFSVASFNVRNLISAGVTYYDTNRYSQSAYDRKVDWLAEQLYRMDADVVALQETFDPESIDDLVARHAALASARLSASKANKARYKHNWHLPNADTTPDRPQPGLTLVSRRPIKEKVPIQDLSGAPIEVDHDDSLTYRLTKLSRPLQVARVDLGLGVEAWVFNAHLKSKRPTFAQDSTAGDAETFQFFERAAGSFRSLARRSGEALALRRAILERMVGSDVPVLVLGDLNDAIGAVTTEMVSGEMPFRGWSFDVKQGFWDVELYSAVRSHLRRTEESSIYTHIYNGHYDTIDHVLVSQEFYYRNPDRIGDVHFAQVYNDHLVDYSVAGSPGLGDASDHGQVVVRLSLDPERLSERPQGEFELTRDDEGRYRFVLRAANGQIIAESQSYRSKSAARNGIQSVRANAWRARLDDLT